MQKKFRHNKGFALLMAIVVTSMLLLVSFVVADVAVKQLVLTYAGEESQFSFYNADSGLECAEYWDLKATPGVSAFSTSTPSTITCNNQTISTGSETVPTVPTQQSVIGGASVSIFSINYAHGCVIVTVIKGSDNSTNVEARGYNTCDTNALRRYERGIRISY